MHQHRTTGSSWFQLALASALGLCGLSQPDAFADMFYLYNGGLVEGKMLDVTGDIIRYRQGRLVQGEVRRLELKSRLDVITLQNGKTIEGEIVYVDPFKIELRDDKKGRIFVWRLKVKHIEFGKSLVTKGQETYDFSSTQSAQ